MENAKDLVKISKELLTYALEKSEVKEAEAYVSANILNVYRIAYHSRIPSNGLEEPKSNENFGLSLRVLFKDGKYGMGAVDSSFEKEAFREAFEKAARSKVMDTDFHAFAESEEGENKAENLNYKFEDEKGIEKAYEMLKNAQEAAEKESSKEDGINITGEIDALKSAFGVSNSRGISAGEENFMSYATLTTTIEGRVASSGTAFESAPSIEKLDTAKAGSEAAEKATLMKKSKKIESGKHRVLLSESVVGELFYSRFDVDLGSLDYNATPFIGKIGKKVAPDMFSVYDDPISERLIGSRKFTDEGIKCKKTEIIKDGVFTNYLSNSYYTNKKKEWKQFKPGNGFREGLARSYAADVGVSGTNFVVKTGDRKKEELLEELKNGIYVGRLWYTYPVNGYSSPDYTSTIRGDSFIVKEGEIVSALEPNSVRVLDSFDNFMKNILAIGKKQKAMLAWGQENIVVTPEILLSEMNLKKISKGIY